MCNFNWVLDDLTIDVDSSPEGRRALSRQETFVLVWFIHKKEGRTYRQIMRECKLSLEQSQEAVRGLIDLDLLRLR